MAEANENTPLLGAAGGAARQVPQTLFLAALFLFCLVRRQGFSIFIVVLFSVPGFEEGTFICPT